MTALTGEFLYRLWLWCFIFALVCGFFNYVLILRVASYMYIQGMQRQKRRQRLEKAPTEDMTRRVKAVAADLVKENKVAQGLIVCESNIEGMKPQQSGELNDSEFSEEIETSESSDEDAEFRYAT